MRRLTKTVAKLFDDTARGSLRSDVLHNTITRMRASFVRTSKADPVFVNKVAGESRFRAALDNQLSQARTHIDLFLLHRTDWSDSCEANQKAWAIMEEYHAAGKFRFAPRRTAFSRPHM